MKKNVIINVIDFNKFTGQQVKFYLDGTSKIRNNVVIGLENPRITYQSESLITVTGTCENSVLKSGMLNGAWKSEKGKEGYFVTEASLHHICDVYKVSAEVLADDEHYLVYNEGRRTQIYQSDIKESVF